MIPLSRPDITEAEITEVGGVLRTPTLSLGPKLAEFEALMAGLLGVRYAVAVSSGTAGLHLALVAAGIGEKSDILTTPFSFVASANAALFERATPVFADIDEDTLNLSCGEVEAVIEQRYTRTAHGLFNRDTGNRLAGLLPVDVFGHPVDIDMFCAIAERYQLALIEDACEALGSEVYSVRARGWRRAGCLADLSVYAFYPNKQMTTGEGGLVTTNDAVLAARLRAGRNQGRAEGSTWLCHETLGFNYRMDEMSAALGVAQARRFSELMHKRAVVADLYAEALSGTPGIRLPVAERWARVNWFVYVIRLAPEIDRGAFLAHMQASGIEARAYFPAIHLQPLYRDRFGYRPGAFPVCERASASTVALPFFNDLTREQVEAVAEAVREGVKSCVTARLA